MAQFDRLPKEVIALIAIHSAATSALNLTRTCRVIREACADAFVFKEVLLRSQSALWEKDTLDLKAIIARCEKNVSAWARYAVADQKAWEWSQEESNAPFQVPDSALSWIAELFVVKHPLIYHPCWHQNGQLLQDHDNIPAKLLYCFALVLLGSEAPEGGEPISFLQFFADLGPEDDESTRGFLRAFCRSVLLARPVAKRLAAESQEQDGRLAHIPLPRPDFIPLMKVDQELPLPFPSADMKTWDTWYDENNLAMVKSDEFLSGSSWRGYYTYGYSASRLDAPMVDINFSCSPGGLKHLDLNVTLDARDAMDGVGRFRVYGSITRENGGLTFNGNKYYQNGLSWVWDLKVTPFGLLGFWGESVQEGDYDDNFERHGFVWLWRVDST